MQNNLLNGPSQPILRLLLRAGLALVAFCACFPGALRSQSQKPLLLRDPSVSQSQIAFSYAGSIWITARDGSNVRRLTNGGHEGKPIFSPDGSRIAFTGDYDGNRGVYVVSASGGEPRRLTYHPADLNVRGWTPDGRRVFFSSARTAFADGVVQLFTVPVEGGFAMQVPLARASEGSFSPDGTRLAYVPQSSNGKQPGSVIAAVKQNPSGLRILPTQVLKPPFPATIPTTSTLCGSATPFISFPTAMAR